MQHDLIRTSLYIFMLIVPSSFAGTWETINIIGTETRVFTQNSIYPEQHDDVYFSASYQAELRWQNDDNQRVSAIGFTRYDAFDKQRSHSDIRELYWALDADTWSLLIGINKVFWGVTESRHLVDIINQTDQVEDIDQEDKLGQVMVHLNKQYDWGLVDFFLLPYFRPSTTIGAEGRFRGPLIIDNDKAEYENDDEDQHIDTAIRYSHFTGNIDYALSVFHGTSREARFSLSTTDSDVRLIPNYDIMTQWGTELQYTSGDWLWKLEAIYRQLNHTSFFASVAGFEYTQSQVKQSSLDIGWLVELLYDDRDINLTPSTFFDNDIFTGTRLAFNDTQDTSILTGIITDIETQEAFFNLEAERRISENITAGIRARAIVHTDENSLLHPIRQDDYVELQINWYF